MVYQKFSYFNNDEYAAYIVPVHVFLADVYLTPIISIISNLCCLWLVPISIKNTCFLFHTVIYYIVDLIPVIPTYCGSMIELLSRESEIYA